MPSQIYWRDKEMEKDKVNDNLTGINMDEQQQESEQSSDQPGHGYFLRVDPLDEMLASLAAVYSQLLLADRRSFFQIQPQRENYAAIE